MYETINIDRLLASVNKPSRYINNEINSYHKEPVSEKVNFCFAFPDIYEIGFSHLGLKLLYSIINNQPDATADRVYAPDTDMGAQLLSTETPLFGLENKVAIKEYDVIGFTLQSELTYTNILYMLDLAQIPIHKYDRGEDTPLVIAGGPGAVNPEPLCKFFELFFIGEAEEAIVEIKDALKECKDEGLSKKETLNRLKKINGVYVPDDTDNVEPVVKARKYLSYSNGVNYHEQLISWQQTTHDRYICEIMRGCSRSCRFCLAGYLYRPVRERDMESVVKNLAAEVIEYGWEETALLSLSSADYSCIRPLIRAILAELDTYKTDISLPSMRLDSLDDEIIKLFAETGQTGITIAPEAGSQRLRNIINKDISEDQIFGLIDVALKNRWKNIKLYFMIGLPYETDEDIEELISLIGRITETAKKRLSLSISLSPFIPKPHTPFQWAPMLSQEQLFSRISRIKSSLSRYKKVKIKYHTLENSLLECILTRGDRKTADLIYEGYRNGGYFDGWDEYFNFNYWLQAAEKLSIDVDLYRKEIGVNDKLPWEHISIGIDKSYLVKEYQKAKEEAVTQDCRIKCSGCGLCNDKEIAHVYTDNSEPLLQSSQSDEFVKGGDSQQVLKLKKQPVVYKYRIYYAKIGFLKYVTHLDLLRMVHRILRRTGLPIKYTEGFNKHPKINFCPPLSVGVAGLNEFMDIELTNPIGKKAVLESLRNLNIKDLDWVDVIERDFANIQPINDYLYECVEIVIPKEDVKMFKERTASFDLAEQWMMEKVKKGIKKQIDLKPLIIDVSLDDSQSSPRNFVLKITKQIFGASIFNVIESVYGISRKDTGKLVISRKKLFTERSLKINLSGCSS